MFNESKKEDLYNEWHKGLGAAQKIYETLEHPWYRSVMKLLPDLNGKKVLEIGAGRGDFSIWLDASASASAALGASLAAFCWVSWVLSLTSP